MFTVQSYQSGDAIAIAGACEIAVDVWYVNRLFTLNLTDVRFSRKRPFRSSEIGPNKGPLSSPAPVWWTPLNVRDNA